MTTTAPLLHTDVDPSIAAAAAGLRPVINDQDPLPSRLVKFAPSSATYQVSRAGKGTQVTLYGTDEYSHSIAVRVSDFRPYLYISTKSMERSASSPAAFENLVKELVANLNRQLLLITAMQQKAEGWKDAPEVYAIRESQAGFITDRTIGGDKKRITIHKGKLGCMPITGYELKMGLPYRGTGKDAGYRGMDKVQFLQIFFYCPSFVSKARHILQGKHSELGVLGQAKALSRGQDRSQQPDETTASTKGPFRTGSREARAHSDKGQRRFGIDYCPERMDHEPTEVEDEHGDVEEKDDVVEIAYDCLEDVYDGDETQPLKNSLFEATSVTLGFEEDEKPLEHVEGDDDFEETEDGNGHARCDFDVSDDNADVFKARMMKRLAKRFLREATAEVMQKKAPMLARGITYDVYESDIDFVLRFAVDCGFAYEQWLTIDCDAVYKTKLKGYTEDQSYYVRRIVGDRRETRLQIELQCHYKLLRFEADDPIQNTIPDHLWVSLDCEMAPGPKMEFPKPDQNPKLQTVFIIRGKKVKDKTEIVDGEEMKIKNKFTYRSVSFTLLDCDIGPPREYCTEHIRLCFEREAVMFAAIARFVRLLDAHIVSGYNSDHFDLPYMLERATCLGRYVGTDLGRQFSRAWGRSKSASWMTVRKRSFQSAQAGKVEFTDVQAPGVIFLDLLKKFQRDPAVKLRSYSLNAVALEYIGDQKEDISYALINQMQAAGPSERERMRSYCEKDALLVLEIAEAEKILPGMIEMARITRVPLEMLLNRGQQIRAKAALYDATQRLDLGYIFYTRTDAERIVDMEQKLKGAQVVKPKPGIYKNVIVLDWNALYPSEQRTHNLCASTFVDRSYDLTLDKHIQRCQDPLNELTLEERQRRAEDAIFTVPDMVQEFPYKEATNPSSFRFLKHSVKIGLMPLVQDVYAAARDKAKDEMTAAYKAGDDALGDLLNKRQLAYKLQANSLYGIGASPTAPFFTPPVADTITRRGRCGLFLMSSEVQTEFAEYKPDVIYGDTDSVFVAIGVDMTLDEVAKLGVAMAAHVTKVMRERYTLDMPEKNVLKLAFEKVYKRILMKAKKRYAGLKYEYSAKTGALKASPGEGIPSMSGFESKRRDVTLIVSTMVPDVLALLLETDDTDANMERARAYIWQHMVRPLLDNTINLRDLVVTKQLRQLPSEYKANSKGAALPIHVQTADKLTERAGGEGANNAPKAGQRLPYVVVAGSKEEKVSSRGEDPMYALDNNEPLDSRYYLDSHIRPTMLGILVPIFGARNNQTQLVKNSNVSGLDVQWGKTEEARKKHNETVAAKYLFGHPTDYIDPVSPEVRERYTNLVPATRRKDPPKVPHPRYVPRRDTTKKTVITKPSAGANGAKQRTLSAFMKQGARCSGCKVMFEGELEGFVCEKCSANGMADTNSMLRKYLIDIEDLYGERRELVDTCQKCMGCAEAPKPITCMNVDCRILWERKLNQRSLTEAERRMNKVYETACNSGVVERVEL